ncbi:MAG: sigma-54-dependent transcriptional regulator [Polyangiales bacterium]
MPGRVLVVDDEASMRDYLQTALPRRGFEVSACATAEEASARLTSEEVDVVLTDLNMPGTTGIELCSRVVQSHPDVPVIVLTAFGNFQSAVEAIRAGAYDFLTKPVHLEPLSIALERAVQHRRLRTEVKRLRLAVEHGRGLGELVGQSPSMQEVYDLLARVADSDATVLVTGESGTGKEVVARALHRRGRRASGPFVAINCAAMPESLLESELFGHVRGAFTDAKASRTGLFLQAHGGTLFLDEIGELPLSLQPKLLRALQEKRVRPVGATQEMPFDARIVAATNRDLETAVEEGRFREDLFFRINVIQIDLPPLRARGNDILYLAQTFLRTFAERASKKVIGLSTSAGQKMLEYSWPGNVRELQNAMERAVALARFEEITVDDLPERVKSWKPQQVLVTSEDPSELVPLEEVEKRYVMRVFEAVNKNRSKAARILGVDRKTLRRKLASYGALEKSETDDDDKE